MSLSLLDEVLFVALLSLLMSKLVGTCACHAQESCTSATGGQSLR